MVESACNAGDARDAGLTPESGRSPGEGNGNPPFIPTSILAWEIPQTEEPGGLVHGGRKSQTQLECGHSSQHSRKRIIPKLA